MQRRFALRENGRKLTNAQARRIRERYAAGGISLAALAMFRGRLLRAVQHDPQAPPVDSLVGEIGVAIEDLLPGAIGRIELRGSAWSARNRSTAAVPRGGRCRVVRVDGLTLLVEPEGVVS